MPDAAERLTREIHASIVAPAFTPESTPTNTGASPGARTHDAEAIASARAELVWIGRAKAWRMVQGAKSNAAYRAIARARFGPDWERQSVDACTDPIEKLRRIKASRAYRMIVAIQSNALVRALRRDDRPMLPR